MPITSKADFDKKSQELAQLLLGPYASSEILILKLSAFNTDTVDPSCKEDVKNFLGGSIQSSVKGFFHGTRKIKFNLREKVLGYYALENSNEAAAVIALYCQLWIRSGGLSYGGLSRILDEPLLEKRNIDCSGQDSDILINILNELTRMYTGPENLSGLFKILKEPLARYDGTANLIALFTQATLSRSESSSGDSLRLRCLDVLIDLAREVPPNDLESLVGILENCHSGFEKRFLDRLILSDSRILSDAKLIEKYIDLLEIISNRSENSGLDLVTRLQQLNDAWSIRIPGIIAGRLIPRESMASYLHDLLPRRHDLLDRLHAANLLSDEEKLKFPASERPQRGFGSLN